MSFSDIYNSAKGVAMPLAGVTVVASLAAYGFRLVIAKHITDVQRLRMGLSRPMPTADIMSAANTRWGDGTRRADDRALEFLRNSAGQEEASRMKVEGLANSLLKVCATFAVIFVILAVVTYFYTPKF
jgi:hypothetical protein